VLAGAVASIRALKPQLVIQGGDLIDNDQANELDCALAVLRGGNVHPGSGPHGYHGVQDAANPDPFYYRPDVDAPRHPGLLRAAARPFSAAGLRSRWCPVLGDHDVLVAGELVPTPLTESLALGTRALWDLPQGLTIPPGERLTTGPGSSPDGPPQPLLVNQLLTQALQGPTVQVPADPARRELPVGESITRLGNAAAGITLDDPARLDYSLAVGPRLQVIVLDLARRDGGSGGLVVPGQPAWLAAQLAAAGNRWVIVASHQPLESSEGGSSVLALLDGAPRVIATLDGHTHRNRIVARPTHAGGYWQITTASLIDYPQQARGLRILATAAGGVAIQTWMLDHVDPGPLGRISRELSFIDAQGGRPMGFAGTRRDRNVTLFRRAVA
jgi:3',5'-cyclic AMP phosphodiesterase CpdA